MLRVVWKKWQLTKQAVPSHGVSAMLVFSLYINCKLQKANPQHAFHFHCISRWLKTRHGKSLPHAFGWNRVWQRSNGRGVAVRGIRTKGERKRFCDRG